MRLQAIPILRIFDEPRARAFYVDFLGMTVDWEHRFDPDSPVYLQVSRDGLVLHLSEHSGDGTPGSKLLITMDDLDGYHAEIVAREYRYNRPAIEQAPWGDRTFEAIDPFGNRLLFNETAPR